MIEYIIREGFYFKMLAIEQHSGRLTLRAGQIPHNHFFTLS